MWHNAKMGVSLQPTVPPEARAAQGATMNLARDDFMVRHEYNVGTGIIAMVFGAMVPAATIDTLGKIGIAFGCGFASLAGQALWRMAVRRFYSMRRG